MGVEQVERLTLSVKMQKQSSPKATAQMGLRLHTEGARTLQKHHQLHQLPKPFFTLTHKQVFAQSEAAHEDRRRRLGTVNYAESYLHTLFTILGICIKKEIWNSLIEHAGGRNNASLKRGIEANRRDGAGGESGALKKTHIP